MGIQSCESPNFENFKIPNLGVPGQNDILVHAPWLSIENNIRGRWWLPPSLSPGESSKSIHQKCSNYALTNLFGLCKSVWIIDLLVTHFNPHYEAPTCPCTPKLLQTRKRTPTPCPFDVFTFGLAVESMTELGGASLVHYVCHVQIWHSIHVFNTIMFYVFTNLMIFANEAW